MSNDSDRLLAEGRRLIFRRDDEERAATLRYDMRGVKYLEDYFGSLESAGQALEAIGQPADRSAVVEAVLALADLSLDTEQIESLRQSLAAVVQPAEHKRAEKLVCLLHAGLHREMSLDEVWEWADMRDLYAYAVAITLAIRQAFPAIEGTSPNVGETETSPGTPSGTSPSAPDSALRASGV